MSTLKVNANPAVAEKMKTYPPKVRKRLKRLRKLILDAAKSEPTIIDIEETLKWREPSYLVKKGSTIRMDWKQKTPDQYQLYFKCTSKLVRTFKEIYGDTFKYETTRALVFDLDDNDIPEKEIKECISMALKYHTVKDLPLLGYEAE